MAADVKEKKMANLTTFMLVQDYQANHWNWSDEEKAQLATPNETAKVIYDRLIAADVEVKEAYAINHDKDEHELWDEYQRSYVVAPTSSHIHFLAKLNTGVPLDAIAKITGVASSFIEKPKRGRYAYDNMLSYLIHIKYPNRYQYEPHDVITLAGRDYMEYYSSRKWQWMQGCAEKLVQEAKHSIPVIEQMIVNGELTEEEFFTNPKYETIGILEYKRIEKLFENVRAYNIKRKLYSKRKEQNNPSKPST